jgi:predicted dehydrogenase
MVNIGVIGYGYWGPNLVRNFFTNGNCKVSSVADSRAERLEHLSLIYPSIKRVRTA